LQSVADLRSRRDEYSKPDTSYAADPAGLNSEEHRYIRDFFPWESVRSDTDSFYSVHMSRCSSVTDVNPRSLNQLSSDDLRYCKTGTDVWPKSPSERRVVQSPRFDIDDRDRWGKCPASGLDSPPSYIRLRSPRAGSSRQPHDVSPRATRASPRSSPRARRYSGRWLEYCVDDSGRCTPNPQNSIESASVASSKCLQRPRAASLKWDCVASECSDEEPDAFEAPSWASVASVDSSSRKRATSKPGDHKILEQEHSAGSGPTCQERIQPARCFARESIKATTAAAYSAAAQRAARPPPRAGVLHQLPSAKREGFRISRRDEVMDVVNAARWRAAVATPPRSRAPSVDDSQRERKAMLSHFACAKLSMRSGSPSPLQAQQMRSSSVQSERKASSGQAGRLSEQGEQNLARWASWASRAGEEEVWAGGQGSSRGTPWVDTLSTPSCGPFTLPRQRWKELTPSKSRASNRKSSCDVTKCSSQPRLHS